jgi:SWI/SNF-related matrix-associated actin-dependent regulator 1 of chromatin subfamily A
VKFTPRPYQLIGRDFLKARNFAMLGDAPGIGKTGQAIISVEKDWRVLVVCPASVKSQWQQAFIDWCNRPATIIESSRQPINAWQNAFIFIVNYDLLVREQVLFQLNRIQWDCIIVDEAHKVKSMTAKRTKSVLTMKGLRGRTKRMWFLTGTPVKNRPVDLFPVLRSCAPDVLGPYNSYMKFCYRYCGAYQSKFGLDVSGATHLDELREKMKSFMLRREKRDVLIDLPPRVVIHNQIKCTEAVKELIKEEEAQTIEQAGDRDPALFKLGEVQRIRGALARHKVPLCVDYIKDLLESEDKIVVFYYHKEVLRELQKATSSFRSIYIDGTVSPALRRERVRSFIDNRDARLFFGQMEACGEGIDGLQNGCSTCVFVEPSWSHTDIEQCIGRLERSGQRSDINVHILTIKDTLEARMLEVVAEKLRTDAVLYGTTNKKEKENMAKPNKKQEAAEALAKALAQFMLAYDTEAEIPTKETEEVEEVKPVKAAKVIEPPKDADVSEEAIRARCGDICAAQPNGGRDKCAAAVKKICGGKIVDLKTPAQRLQAMEALDKLYAEVAK